MSFLHSLLDFFLHIDTHLGSILQEYGALTYVIIFVIILCETGLVIAPFLPGDSLLFAAGAFAGKGDLNIAILLALLAVAAIGGDAMNFFIGRFFGKAIVKYNSRWINQKHLDKTNRFYAKHGGKTIVLARFMPIVRTLAPFVAGIGKMSSPRFFAYNVVGGLLWVGLFTLGGYFFGSLPFVEENFSIVILIIIALSVVPALYEWLRSRVASV